MPNEPSSGPPWSTISNPKALATALRNATLFASDDDFRPVLCCVQMDANADRLQIVACDSYLLLVQELAVGREPRITHENGYGEWNALVHRDSLRLMGALLQGVKDVSADLECTHAGDSEFDPGGEVDDVEMTVSLNDGPPVPLAAFKDLVSQTEHNTDDPYVCAAAHLVVTRQVGAASMLQRRLHVGYDRSRRLIDELERLGVVGPEREHYPTREVLMSVEQLALAGFGEPPVFAEPDEEATEGPKAVAAGKLINAGQLTLRVGESDLQLPLYDEGVYPDWERLVDGDVGAIDGAQFGASVIKRLGSLQLPSNSTPPLDWTFCGDNKPVLFNVGWHDDDLKMRGAFMPLRSS